MAAYDFSLSEQNTENRRQVPQPISMRQEFLDQRQMGSFSTVYAIRRHSQSFPWMAAMRTFRLGIPLVAVQSTTGFKLISLSEEKTFAKSGQRLLRAPSGRSVFGQAASLWQRM